MLSVCVFVCMFIFSVFERKNYIISDIFLQIHFELLFETNVRCRPYISVAAIHCADIYNKY